MKDAAKAKEITLNKEKAFHDRIYSNTNATQNQSSNLESGSN